MKVSWSVLSLLAAAFALAPISCGLQPPDAGGTLDEKNLDALPDVDGDGLPEFEAPEGVDTSQMLGIEFINEITPDEATGLVSGDIPVGVLNLIDIEVDFEITLNYAGGISDAHEGSRPLEEFRLAFEVACPEEVLISITVVANIPLLGPQTLFQQEFIASAEGDGAFECDSTFRIRAFINEQGFPAVETSVEAQ
ncbi:MAG: hypothetical protein IID39_04190 [Planctomycetes bacterium]|nr:hypothetical protein [Planctomycetota bacterium]